MKLVLDTPSNMSACGDEFVPERDMVKIEDPIIFASPLLNHQLMCRDDYCVLKDYIVVVSELMYVEDINWVAIPKQLMDSIAQWLRRIPVREHTDTLELDVMHQAPHHLTSLSSMVMRHRWYPLKLLSVHF